MYASRSLTGTHVFYSSLVYVTLLVSGCLGLKASSETSILPPYLVRASKAMFGVINRRARLYWRRRGGNDPPDSWPTHPSKRIPLPWHLRFHSFRPRENSLFIRSRLHLFVPHFSYIAGLSEAQLFINNLGESIIYIWKTRLGEQGNHSTYDLAPFSIAQLWKRQLAGFYSFSIRLVKAFYISTLEKKVGSLIDINKN